MALRLLRRHSMTVRPGQFRSIRFRVVFDAERLNVRHGVTTLRRLGAAQMDEGIRAALDRLAATAEVFARATKTRNPAYDWMTQNESTALADLRYSVAELQRAEEKATGGRRVA